MHSWTGAYVSDALEATELQDFEAHLQECAQCREEVAMLQETMAEVGSLHEATPPPALRASILNAISSTTMLPAEDPAADRVVDEQEAPDQPRDVAPVEALSSPRRPFATWLAVAATLAAVALGGVTVWQQSNLQSIQAAEQQRIELLAAPDLQVSTTTLDGGQLTYLVSADRGEALITSADLPDPGTERSWQVWVMQDGTPRSGAVVDEGGRVQEWINDVAGGDALAVTNEPMGGSPAPTGEVQAMVKF